MAMAAPAGLQSDESVCFADDITGCVPGLRRFVTQRMFTHGMDDLDPDDVVQEALLRAWSHRGRLRFENAQALSGYLRRVATHHLIDTVRRVSRRPNRVSLEDDTVAARGPSPLDAVLQREQRHQLRESLRTLKPAMRRAILQHRLGERDFDRLATTLGSKTPGAARVAVSRGMRSLTREMAVRDAQGRRGAGARMSSTRA